MLEGAAEQVVVADGYGAFEDAVCFGIADLVLLDFFNGVGAALTTGFVARKAGGLRMLADGVDGFWRQRIDTRDGLKLLPGVAGGLQLSLFAPLGGQACLFGPMTLNGGSVVLGAQGKSDFLLARVASEDVGRDAPAKVVDAGLGVALKAGGKHWHGS